MASGNKRNKGEPEGNGGSAESRNSPERPRWDHTPPKRYRVVVFDEPRGPWRDTREQAMRDAIDQDLAAWDDSKREHYLAVPTDIEVERTPV